MNHKRVLAVLLLMGMCFSVQLLKGNGSAEAASALQLLLDDYDQMWDVLYESYPFLSCTGKDAEQLEALRLEKRALIGKKAADPAGLYHILQDTCSALGNIAHLRAVSPEEYSAFYADRSEDRENGIIHKDTDIWLDPKTVEVYAQLGFREARPANSSGLYSVGMDYFPDLHAAYFRFPTFYSEELTRQAVPIAAFLEKHPDVEHLIIDITGNRGGYTSAWINGIVSAFPDPVEWQSTSYIRITETVARTYEGIPVEPIDFEAADLPDWVESLGMTHQGTHRISLPLEAYAGEKVERSVKRWLVIDGEVASAAEMFARFCKDTGWAAVAGTAAKGDGLVSAYAPSVVRLNNTGLLFMFFAESGVNEDGSLNVLRGTEPDYFAKPTESPLEACIRWIAISDGREP